MKTIKTFLVDINEPINKNVGWIKPLNNGYYDILVNKDSQWISVIANASREELVMLKDVLLSIGNIKELNTLDKNTLVGAINELLQKVIIIEDNSILNNQNLKSINQDLSNKSNVEFNSLNSSGSIDSDNELSVGLNLNRNDGMGYMSINRKQISIWNANPNQPELTISVGDNGVVFNGAIKSIDKPILFLPPSGGFGKRLILNSDGSIVINGNLQVNGIITDSSARREDYKDLLFHSFKTEDDILKIGGLINPIIKYDNEGYISWVIDDDGLINKSHDDVYIDIKLIKVIDCSIIENEGYISGDNYKILHTSINSESKGLNNSIYKADSLIDDGYYTKEGLPKMIMEYNNLRYLNKYSRDIYEIKNGIVVNTTQHIWNNK